ncbi:MAG: hypothetical protein ACT4PE_07915 [Candidatus Eiseniibacteriota bacterium]
MSIDPQDVTSEPASPKKRAGRRRKYIAPAAITTFAIAVAGAVWTTYVSPHLITRETADTLRAVAEAGVELHYAAARRQLLEWMSRVSFVSSRTLAEEFNADLAHVQVLDSNARFEPIRKIVDAARMILGRNKDADLLEAEQALLRLIRDSSTPTDLQKVSWSLVGVSRTLQHYGVYSKTAEEAFQHARELTEHPEIGTVYNGLGVHKLWRVKSSILTLSASEQIDEVNALQSVRRDLDETRDLFRRQVAVDQTATASFKYYNNVNYADCLILMAYVRCSPALRDRAKGIFFDDGRAAFMKAVEQRLQTAHDFALGAPSAHMTMAEYWSLVGECYATVDEDVDEAARAYSRSCKAMQDAIHLGIAHVFETASAAKRTLLDPNGELREMLQHGECRKLLEAAIENEFT